MLHTTRFSTALFALLYSIVGFAQKGEILLNQNSFPHPEAAATIGSKTVFTAYQLFPRVPQNSPAMIYLMDNERFAVTDSLNPTRQYGFYAPFIDDVLAIGDSLFAVEISDAEPDGSRGGADNMVLFLDTAFQVVDTYRVRSNDTTYESRQLSLIDDELIISFRENISGGYKPRFHIYKLSTKQEVQRVIFPDSSINDLNIIRNVYASGKGYLAFTDLWQDKFTLGYVLDSNFRVQEVLKTGDPRFTTILSSAYTGLPFKPDQIIYSDSEKIFATGYFNGRSGEYMTLIELDQNLRLTGIDTFSTPCVPLDHNFCDPFLRDFSLGLSDFNTLDSIFIAASQSPVREFDVYGGVQRINDLGMIKPEQNIYVYNIDTAGNVNWQKEVQQDSVIFISYEIEATPDGGAMVFSSKYDLKHKLEAHMRISIIKLDHFGNIVGEQEFAAPRPQWSVYPNPAKGKVQITGLPDAQLRKKVVLMDLSGKTVLEQQYKNGEDLQLPAALQGTYLLQVQNENGRRLGVRKIVVE